MYKSLIPLVFLGFIMAAEALVDSSLSPPHSNLDSHDYPPMNLFKLTDPKALCLDGTPGAYYLRTVPGSRDWMFYFEGGGWCYNEQDCYGRSNGNLGSSKAYPTTMSDNGQGLLSRNNATNYFANYNLVYMKYCDGNSFSGDRTDSMTVNGRSLYFRGKAIRESVLTQVLATTTLGEAERVVQTGCSAGGLSTFLHSDSVGRWVADNLKSVTSFVAIPISGFFLLETNVLGEPIYESQMRTIFALSNATSGLNPTCVEALPSEDTWKCNFAEFSYAYSQVRTFVLNSEMDSWQGGCIMTSMTVDPTCDTCNGNCSAAPGWKCASSDLKTCPSGTFFEPALIYQQKFRDRMYTNAGMQRAGNGGYFSSCFTHCEGQSDGAWNNWRVGGKSMGQAVADWYTGSSGAPVSQNTYRDCQLLLDGNHQCDSQC